MTQRELNGHEVAQIYKQICDLKLVPLDINYERKYSEQVYELDGKRYTLVFDPAGDWFCDIIYEETVGV